jgi:hypothetical protein
LSPTTSRPQSTSSMTSRGQEPQEKAIVEPTVLDNGINDEDGEHASDEGHDCEIRPMEAIITKRMPSIALCERKWKERESFDKISAHSLTDQGLQTRAHKEQHKTDRSSPTDSKEKNEPKKSKLSSPKDEIDKIKTGNKDSDVPVNGRLDVDKHTTGGSADGSADDHGDELHLPWWPMEESSPSIPASTPSSTPWASTQARAQRGYRCPALQPPSVPRCDEQIAQDIEERKTSSEESSGQVFANLSPETGARSTDVGDTEADDRTAADAVRLVSISEDIDFHIRLQSVFEHTSIVTWKELTGDWRKHRDKLMQSANVLWINLRHFHVADGTQRDRKLADRMLSYIHHAEAAGIDIAIYAPSPRSGLATASHRNARTRQAAPPVDPSTVRLEHA